ncbi:MAG TPA: KH domain-containing protein [Vicinamibacterales bacterium]|nr:KH domain-containing protein [Vicinamibacterales bacterium]
MSRARDVVEAVARGLAARPDDVQVIEVERRGQLVVELTMAPGELGRVIGRQGRTAAAVRTLAATAAELDGQRVHVDFRDDD